MPEKLRLTEESLFRILLNWELERRRAANPRYSLRAFARLLKIDPTQLSRILTGSRRPGTQLLPRAQKILGFPMEVFTSFENRTKREIDSGSEMVTARDLGVVFGWEHFAIYSLLDIPNAPTDARGISKTLGFEAERGQKVLDELVAEGLLSFENGAYREISNADWLVVTPRPSPNNDEAYRTLHRTLALRSLESLDSDPRESRSQSSSLAALSPELLPLARLYIGHFRRTLMDLLSDYRKDNSEVYALQISLFPLTNMRERKTS